MHARLIRPSPVTLHYPPYSTKLLLGSTTLPCLNDTHTRLTDRCIKAAKTNAKPYKHRHNHRARAATRDKTIRLSRPHKKTHYTAQDTPRTVGIACQGCVHSPPATLEIKLGRVGLWWLFRRLWRREWWQRRPPRPAAPRRVSGREARRGGSPPGCARRRGRRPRSAAASTGRRRGRPPGRPVGKEVPEHIIVDLLGRLAPRKLAAGRLGRGARRWQGVGIPIRPRARTLALPWPPLGIRGWVLPAEGL